MTLTPLLVDRAQEEFRAVKRVVASRRYVPAFASVPLRTAVGFALAMAATALAVSPTGGEGMIAALAAFGVAWLASVVLTDRYRHKYPYRYYSYLIASVTKAAAVLAAMLAVASWVLAGSPGLVAPLWQAFVWFVVADGALSVPRRLRPLDKPFDPAVLKSREMAAQAEPASMHECAPAAPVAGQATVGDLGGVLDARLLARVRAAVPDLADSQPALVISKRDAFGRRTGPHAPVDLLVSTLPVNDLRRINRFLLACADALRMGGHFVIRYETLEQRRTRLAGRYRAFSGLTQALDFAWHRVGPKIPTFNRLYFALTRGRNRALSKAEVWGRLSFCGLKVVAEAEDGPLHVVTAQRIALPITNKVPSYYPIVGLTKVGLDGQLLQTHKVRSMYPFSEFLQKQIFDAHGLVGTGKFKNDFRLTEYGKFLRRHWIDELPQLYDWLRGDIKLVGMRATSPHFLSLYPEEFIRHYVLVKPGLVPPLFPEGTEGFNAIVDIEHRYLRAYASSPLRADAAVLWETFKAIVFQGVRSK